MDEGPIVERAGKGVVPLQSKGVNVSNIGIRNGVGLGLALLTSAAILGSGGASAFAGTTSTTGSASGTLAEIQSRAAAAISLRVRVLDQASAKVDRSKRLGPEAAALEHYLGADIAPLQALGQKIASDTNEATAKADYQNIFKDFRVIALVLPAARLAEEADGVVHGKAPRFAADAHRAALHERSTNDAAVAPLISNLDNETSAASDAVSGVASSVLGFTPSQWNANHALLSPARAAIRAALADVKKARYDARRIKDSSVRVRPAAGAHTSSSTS